MLLYSKGRKTIPIESDEVDRVAFENFRNGWGLVLIPQTQLDIEVLSAILDAARKIKHPKLIEILEHAIQNNVGGGSK